jgi:hypothetical protein
LCPPVIQKFGNPFSVQLPSTLLRQNVQHVAQQIMFYRAVAHQNIGKYPDIVGVQIEQVFGPLEKLGKRAT